MIEPGRAAPLPARSDLVYAVVLLVAAVHFADLRSPPPAADDIASIEQVVTGEAGTPFQYRILAPMAVHGTWQILRSAGLEMGMAPVAAMMEAVLVILIVLTFHRLLAFFLEDPAALRIAGLTILVPLWTVFLGRDGDLFWHAYDLPAVLVFVLAMLALAGDRLRWFYAIFVLGTLNRETTLFLVPLFLLSHAPLRSRRWLAAHALAFVTLWIALKGVLVAIYGGERLFYLTLSVNARRLALEPTHTLQLLSLFGYALLPVCVFYRRIPSPWARRLLWVAVPHAAAMLLVGVVLEFRIWGELIPIFWLPAVLLAGRAFGVQIRSTARPDAA